MNLAGKPVVRPFDPNADLAWATALVDAELGGRMQARRDELELEPRL